MCSTGATMPEALSYLVLVQSYDAKKAANEWGKQGASRPVLPEHFQCRVQGSSLGTQTQRTRRDDKNKRRVKLGWLGLPH